MQTQADFSTELSKLMMGGRRRSGRRARGRGAMRAAAGAAHRRSRSVSREESTPLKRLAQRRG